VTTSPATTWDVIVIGSGIGGLWEFEVQEERLLHKGIDKVSPFTIPKLMVNSASGHVSSLYGVKGPNFAVATACASAANSIGSALRAIQYGDADVMITGGSEAALTPIGLAGFQNMRALSFRGDAPQQASRPWDRDRDGFVMADGAGVLVLEELEHARARGAKIYGEIVGYGATSDGFDMVQPSGEGAVRCMKMAMAGIGEKFDYINPHATSTPIGDLKEIEAIREVFGKHVPPISATKSLTGHSLGAAGVQEAIYSILMMKNGFICESAHIEELDPDFADMPIVRSRLDNAEINVVISNSFGFGGTNGTLAFQRYNG